MYDKKMAAAVETAQKRLMSTAGKGSALMTSISDLAELTKLTEKLDPSKIDFDRGGLERIRAISYWNRFEENYPELRQLFERLVRSKKVLSNSITTLKRFRSEFDAEYERFCGELSDKNDEQFVQQAMVAQNMQVLLKNSVEEHEVLYEHISQLTNILESSLNIAIFIAKQKFDRSFGETGNAIKVITSDTSNRTFQEQYARLMAAVHNT